MIKIFGLLLSAAMLLTGAPMADNGAALSFEGHLIDSAMNRMPDTAIILDDGTITAASDSKGNFKIDSIPLGEHVLTVKGPDGVDAVRTIVLEAGTSDRYSGWTRLTTGALSITIPPEALGLDVEIKVLGEDLTFTATEFIVPQTRGGQLVVHVGLSSCSWAWLPSASYGKSARISRYTDRPKGEAHDGNQDPLRTGMDGI